MAEVVIFVTASSEQEATKIGRLLVEKKLAACVNLMPGIRSIFEWEGKVSEGQECLMIIKSTTEVFDVLEAAIKAHHSYDVPEIIALPIVKGSAAYLAWVKEMTKLPLGSHKRESPLPKFYSQGG